MQQRIFAFEGCDCMLHERGIGLCSACRVLPRPRGAFRHISERAMLRLVRTHLEHGMKHVACSQKLGCIYTERPALLARWSVLRATRQARAASEIVSLAIGQVSA
jgi:hypothetical protein